MVGGLCSWFSDMLFGGKLSYNIWLRRHLLCFAYRVAMVREDLVSVILVGIHGDSVTRRLWRDSPFQMIFVAYVDRAGCDPVVTSSHLTQGGGSCEFVPLLM